MIEDARTLPQDAELETKPYYRRAWEILGLPAGEHGLDAPFEDDPFEPLDVPADRRSCSTRTSPRSRPTARRVA